MIYYSISNQTWYHDQYQNDQITIMCSDDHPSLKGVDYEFELVWDVLRDRKCMKIEIFEGSLKALQDLPDLFSSLAKMNKSNPTQEEIISLLNSLGYVDITDRVRK